MGFVGIEPKWDLLELSQNEIYWNWAKVGFIRIEPKLLLLIIKPKWVLLELSQSRIYWNWVKMGFINWTKMGFINCTKLGFIGIEPKWVFHWNWAKVGFIRIEPKLLLLELYLFQKKFPILRTLSTLFWKVIKIITANNKLRIL